MPKLHQSSIRNRVYFSIKPKKGIMVIKISNIYSHPMFYSVLLNINGKKEMKMMSPTLGYVDPGHPQTYSFMSKKKGYLNIDFNRCFGQTDSIYAIQKEGEKYGDLKWKVLQDSNLALSKVKVAKDDMIWLRFSQTERQKDSTADSEADAQRTSVPSVYNFMSYVGTRFNEDSYEDLLEMYNDEENSPMVRVINSDRGPWIRMNPPKFKNLEEVKEKNHIQITYTLNLATTEE